MQNDTQRKSFHFAKTQLFHVNPEISFWWVFSSWILLHWKWGHQLVIIYIIFFFICKTIINDSFLNISRLNKQFPVQLTANMLLIFSSVTCKQKISLRLWHMASCWTKGQRQFYTISRWAFVWPYEQKQRMWKGNKTYCKINAATTKKATSFMLLDH